MIALETTEWPEAVPSEKRKQALALAVAGEVRGGWNVQSQTDYQAVLVKGHRPNHLLHLLLTILTLGLWLIPWVVVMLTGGVKHKVVAVDDYGNVLL